tara:strand:- start:106 stop:2013 length:1908 start_codon:yes stop_codon:yes gene_type:complete
MENLELKEAMKIAGQDPKGMFALSLKKTIETGSLDKVASEKGVDLSMFGRPAYKPEVQEQPSFLERTGNAAINAIPVAGPVINALRKTDAIGDIKQAGLNVLDTAKQSTGEFQDIADREQKMSSTVLQGAGQALGTGSKLFGDVFTGALKAVSTPEQEEFATKLITSVIGAARDTEVGGMVEGGLNQLNEDYEALKISDPEAAGNQRAKLQIAEALSELLGLGSAQRIAGQADDLVAQVLRKTDEVIANPSAQPPEIIEAITKNIEDTQTQFAKVREPQPEVNQLDEALKNPDTGITTKNANIGQKLVAGESLLSPRDKKRLLKADRELGNKYMDVLEKSELDDTAPPLFEVATNDVSEVFTEFENFNKVTGSKIGDIKQKINATPVNKPKVQEVINELDSILAKKGLSKTDDGLYVIKAGSNSPFGATDVKNINEEIVRVLDNINNAQTNEQLILGMESLGNKINYNLDTSISNSLQGLSKKVDGQLRDIRNTLMSPDELVEFEKYSKAIEFINEFKNSDNKIKTLINREDSMRSGDLQKVAKTLEEVTGKDIRDNTRLMKILIDASPQGGTNRSLLNQRITEGAGVGAELVTGRPLGALQEILRIGGKKIFDVDKLKEIKKAIDTNIEIKNTN